MAQLRVWFLLGRFGDLFFLFPSIRHDAVVSVGVLVNAVDANYINILVQSPILQLRTVSSCHFSLLYMRGCSAQRHNGRVRG